jgi:secretion/DNA translocation related TadE-like protein
VSRDEHGSAVPLAVACLGLLLMLGSALGVVAAMVVDHRHAQGAADLAALSGAADLARGGDGCSAAGRTAADNDAQLTECHVEGSDLRVAVTVAGPRWLGSHGDLAAQARAGPG